MKLFNTLPIDTGILWQNTNREWLNYVINAYNEFMKDNYAYLENIQIVIFEEFLEAD